MAGLISPGIGPANLYLLGSENAAHTITGVTSGASAPIQVLGGPRDVTFWLTSVGTTSGGTILIEETDAPEDTTPTWSVIQTILASSFTGGAKTAAHVRIGAGVWVRLRISSAITGGGTIYARMSGQ